MATTRCADLVLSIKVVGIILVSALIVIPAAVAFQLAEDFVPTMVLIAPLLFFVSLLVSPRRRARR